MLPKAAFPPAHLLRPTIRSEPFFAGLPTALRRSDRDHLAAIATPIRLPKGQLLIQRGAPSHAIFNITSGTACVYREVGTSRRVLAFLFGGDLSGLSKDGVYVNTVRAITPLTAFKIPLEPLTAMLRRDADLQFRFLCKAVHALRETQRQAVVVAHRDPADRLAAFLSMLESAQQEAESVEAGTIPLPMTARDIAEYADLSVDDVRRAFDELRRDGAIQRLPNRAIRVVNRRQLNRRVAGV